MAAGRRRNAGAAALRFAGTEAGHSTGKNMDCVAEFTLRRKTRPGMPFLEKVGRPMKFT